MPSSVRSNIPLGRRAAARLADRRRRRADVRRSRRSARDRRSTRRNVPSRFSRVAVPANVALAPGIVTCRLSIAIGCPATQEPAPVSFTDAPTAARKSASASTRPSADPDALKFAARESGRARFCACPDASSANPSTRPKSPSTPSAAICTRHGAASPGLELGGRVDARDRHIVRRNGSSARPACPSFSESSALLRHHVGAEHAAARKNRRPPTCSVAELSAIAPLSARDRSRSTWLIAGDERRVVFRHQRLERRREFRDDLVGRARSA